MTFPLPPRFSVRFPDLDDAKQPRTAKECVFLCHRNAFLLRRIDSKSEWVDSDWTDATTSECLKVCFKIDTDSTAKNMSKFSDQCKSFFALAEEIEDRLDKKVV